ncbi:hypothetical protein ACA910_015147 [Epithemia clementina (nom. ined.)]
MTSQTCGKLSASLSSLSPLQSVQRPDAAALVVVVGGADAAGGPCWVHSTSVPTEKENEMRQCNNHKKSSSQPSLPMEMKAEPPEGNEKSDKRNQMNHIQ